MRFRRGLDNGRLPFYPKWFRASCVVWKTGSEPPTPPPPLLLLKVNLHFNKQKTKTKSMVNRPLVKASAISHVVGEFQKKEKGRQVQPESKKKKDTVQIDLGMRMHSIKRV